MSRYIQDSHQKERLPIMRIGFQFFQGKANTQNHETIIVLCQNRTFSGSERLVSENVRFSKSKTEKHSDLIGPSPPQMQIGFLDIRHRYSHSKPESEMSDSWKFFGFKPDRSALKPNHFVIEPNRSVLTRTIFVSKPNRSVLKPNRCALKPNHSVMQPPL
jgi:hypothetical protein